MSPREQFDAWAAAPPREWSLERHSDRDSWPGQYRAYHVQCAWEVFEQAAHKIEELTTTIQQLQQGHTCTIQN